MSSQATSPDPRSAYVMLGHNGHFRFTATCPKDRTGQNQVSFDVTANTTADLDGSGAMPAGTKIHIHTAATRSTAPPRTP